jgi:hypothetical protein
MISSIAQNLLLAAGIGLCAIGLAALALCLIL